MVCASLARGTWQRLRSLCWVVPALLAVLHALPPPGASSSPSSSAAQVLDAIFPDDYGRGYSNHRAKRQWGADTREQCALCISSYRPDSCLRCWSSKAAVVPFHALKRRQDFNDDVPTAVDLLYGSGREEEDQEEEEEDGGGEEGLEAVSKRASYGGYRRPMVRRGSGCGCCFMSRFSNQHCCQVCRLASKRTGKRSGDLLTSDLLLTSPLEDHRAAAAAVSNSKRAYYMVSPDCLCCFSRGGSGSGDCCSRCFAK